MPISREDIRSLAQLARLELSEEELMRTEAELESILGYVDRLKGVDTQSIEPLTMPAKSDGWRQDIVAASTPETRQTILANFPRRKDDLLCTPGVFEKPKGGR